MPAPPPETLATTSVERLSEGLDRLGIVYSERQIDRLLQQSELLRKWNRSYNLSAVTEPEQIVSRHILDSLAARPWVEGSKVIDVGSGAGYPGIPLAIFGADQHFTLLDGRGKKTRFIDAVIRDTGIDNALSHHGRAEHFRPEDKFDTLVARAFASLAEIYRLCGHLVKSGGHIIALKGDRPVDELAELESKFGLGGEIHSLDVPFLDARRHVVDILKP